MFGRQDEEVITEQELEDRLVKKIENFIKPVLFQSSSQNIDRLVSFTGRQQGLIKCLLSMFILLMSCMNSGS